MKFTTFMRAAVFTAMSVAMPPSAWADIYKGETAGVGDPVHTMF